MKTLFLSEIALVNIICLDSGGTCWSHVDKSVIRYHIAW